MNVQDEFFDEEAPAFYHDYDDVGSNKSEESDDPLLEADYQGTLISRQWHYVMPSVVVTYIIAQYLISTQTEVCSVAHPYHEFTALVSIAFLSCYAMAFSYHILSVVFMYSWAEREVQHLRGIYMGAATVSMTIVLFFMSLLLLDCIPSRYACYLTSFSYVFVRLLMAPTFPCILYLQFPNLILPYDTTPSFSCGL